MKWLGDGVMFYFLDPGPGVLAALDMVEGAATEALPPAHVGIDAGPVVFQELQGCVQPPSWSTRGERRTQQMSPPILSQSME